MVNQLIDQNILAKEAKTDQERKAQAYGVEEPNPSVISLNAISASHAVNDFLLDYLALRPERPLYYEHFHMLTGRQSLVAPRQDKECPECSLIGLRYGRGDLIPLPCIEEVIFPGRRSDCGAHMTKDASDLFAATRSENRNASHPVNAILNYAYATLESQSAHPRPCGWLWPNYWGSSFRSRGKVGFRSRFHGAVTTDRRWIRA